MAGRITFSKIIRKVHFFASIIIFMMAFFFIISGFILSKHNWFPLGESTTSYDTYSLNYIPDTTNLKVFGNEIKQQFELTGRLGYGRDWRKQITFNVGRPGINYEIAIHENLDSLTIKTNERKTFGEINKRLHRTHGFKGGWKYMLWAILVDLTAISLIVFSITGFLIWYNSRKTLKWGWAILIPTIALVVVMIGYLL